MALLIVFLLAVSLLELMHGSVGVAGAALLIAQTILVGVIVVQVGQLLGHGWPQDSHR